MLVYSDPLDSSAGTPGEGLEVYDSDWEAWVGSAEAMIGLDVHAFFYCGILSNTSRYRYLGAGSPTGEQQINCEVWSGGSSYAGLSARCNGTTNDYELRLFNNGAIELSRYDSGAITELMALTSTHTAGDWNDVSLAAKTIDGSTVRVYMQINGGTVETYDDTSGSRITSGTPGFNHRETTNGENVRWRNVEIYDEALLAGGGGGLALAGIGRGAAARLLGAPMGFAPIDQFLAISFRGLN